MTVETLPPSSTSSARWSADGARGIHTRIEIDAQLVALAPLHLGAGEAGDAIDMPLLRDEGTGQPLLCGSSLAGALRAYLTALARASGDETYHRAILSLFGSLDGGQSAVLIDDAIWQRPAGDHNPAHGPNPANSPTPELRSGVALNATTRTAEHDALYTVEVWPAGVTFSLRLELVLDGRDDTGCLIALLTALHGLHGATDGIRLGARGHRGFGRVEARAWTVRDYDLRRPDGLLSWLTAPRDGVMTRPAATTEGSSTLDQLPPFAGLAPWPDRRQALTIIATCGLEGSLLVRGMEAAENSPDIAHLHSRQENGRLAPVLPGTSLAGALRARALRIANTIGAPHDLLWGIFGPPPRGITPTANAQDAQRPKLWASRLSVSEQVIDGGCTDLAQSRVSIDRFTGGAYPTALFDEQPVFARPDTLVRFTLRLTPPHSADGAAVALKEKAEIGLLLLVLKDLWTGDLPLGGEQAVGRGRLRGRGADVTLPDGQEVGITTRGENGGLIVSDPLALENYVAALHEWVARMAGDGDGKGH